MSGIPVFNLLENVKRITRTSCFMKCRRFVETSASTELNFGRAKPFNSIPGPNALALLSRDFFKFAFARYGSTNYLEINKKLYREFGPIVRLSVVPGKCILLYDPTYIEALYRSEPVWPRRDGFDFVTCYLKHLNEDNFYNGGIFFTNGSDWYEKRSAVNKTMMQPRSAKMYVEPIQDVTEDFIDRIKFIRLSNKEMPENFYSELRKWALEGIGVITLDTRFGCLDGNLNSDSDAYKLIESIKNVVEGTYLLNCYPHMWKYVATPSWRLFVTNLETMSKIVRERILAKFEDKKTGWKEDCYRPRGVLESILTFKKDKPMVPVTLIIDLFMAGIDTTSTAAAATIYHLAKNPEKQEQLYKELKRFLPSKETPVTWEILNELKYAKGCIKESMRISPTVPFLFRTMTRDVVIGDYQIPSGTYVVGNHLLMCNSGNYFKYPDKYIPERWLKSESNTEISVKNSHPFLFLPYGVGARSCLGKRFAEVELETLIAKIFRNFKVEYNHGEMTWTRRLLYGCDKPLQFKMENRPD